jgi:hypothetical protein
VDFRFRGNDRGGPHNRPLDQSQPFANYTGTVTVGKPSGTLADDLGEGCRRGDYVGVGDDVEEGDGV